jgi:Beta-lactamase enzyme family
VKTPLASIVLALAIVTSGLQSSAAADPGAVLTEILTAKTVSADWFDGAFLAAVNGANQIDAILGQLRSKLGAFQSITRQKDGSFLAKFTKGTMLCNISLDPGGRVQGLFFHAPQLSATSLDDALQRITSLSGSTSYVVTRNGKELAAAGQDRALSVGSTFKLSVLAALQAEITKQTRHWTDVVALSPSWKSLPSGILQKWPDNAPLTIQTLATLMISQSDNTAADALIALVGRPAIAPYADGNDPFFTTHDLFVLKSNGHSALRAAWRTGNVKQRTALVAELDAMPLPTIANVETSTANSDIEWHYTNRQLCALMSQVESLPLMSVNPGISTDGWKRVAYKGGSDFGVISMTAWLVADDGTSFCVSATQNTTTKDVDETAFVTAFQGIASFLSQHP